MGYNQGAEGHLFKPKTPKDWSTMLFFIFGLLCLIAGPIFTGFNLLAPGIVLAVFGCFEFIISLFLILLGKYLRPLWLLLGILVFGIGCLVAGLIIISGAIEETPPLATMLIIYGVIGIAIPLITALALSAIK